MVSLKGAPLSLPSVATAQFRVFFDQARAARCLLPLVVLHGCQGADCSVEQLGPTDQLLHAALGELGVVVHGQPSFVGDFNVEPTTIPCLKGISVRLLVDLEAAWASGLLVDPAVLASALGVLLKGIGCLYLIRCPLGAAAVKSCCFDQDRSLQPHMAAKAIFDSDRWTCKVTAPVTCTPLPCCLVVCS